MFTHFGGGVTLPEIGHSLRFNSADSAYLSKTLSASNRKTWTYSAWHKRSALGTSQALLGGPGAVGISGFVLAYETSTDVFWVLIDDGTYVWQGKTSAVFRDTSAHQHVMLVVDTTQATAANRIKLFVNNTQLTLTTASGTIPAQNADLKVNAAGEHNIGRRQYQADYHLNGYLSRICFVDGSALTPSDFAYTDPNGQWRSKSAGACKAVVDAGGANSFMLDFDDGSSTATLGNDYSSKNNDWTLTNFTRSAGVNDDWMEDTPTNNFCTLNLLAPYGTNMALANGALDSSCSSTSNTRGWSSSIAAPGSGKWYAEFTFTATSADNNGGCGVMRSSDYTAPGETSDTVRWMDAANIRQNASSSAYGTALSINDVVMVAYDAAAGKVWFGKNGTWFGSGDPAAGTNASASSITTDGRFSTYHYSTAASIKANFGQRAFAYTPPTGFKALCAKNLPVGSVTTSGSFTGNAAADGPFVWLNGTPTAMTINGNAVTFGTHADKLANGFKLRTNSASYNASGSNTYSVSTNAGVFKYNNAEGNP